MLLAHDVIYNNSTKFQLVIETCNLSVMLFCLQFFILFKEVQTLFYAGFPSYWNTVAFRYDPCMLVFLHKLRQLDTTTMRSLTDVSRMVDAIVSCLQAPSVVCLLVVSGLWLATPTIRLAPASSKILRGRVQPSLQTEQNVCISST